MSSPPPPSYAELAKEVLLRRMRDYSEDNHCAGWLSGLEFLLWKEPAEDDESLSASTRAELHPELRALAEIAGGWWVYEDETQPAERGPVFIPLERWQAVLKSRDSS